MFSVKYIPIAATGVDYDRQESHITFDENTLKLYFGSTYNYPLNWTSFKKYTYNN